MRCLLIVIALLVPRLAAADASAARLVALAAASEQAEHERLVVQLSEEASVTQLLGEQQAHRPRAHCGVGAPPYSAAATCGGITVDGQPLSSILCSLARNQAASAQEALVALTKQRFSHDTDAGDLLLQATSLVNAPSKKLTALWMRWGTLDGGMQNLLDTVLIENGSKAAMGVYARLMQKRLDEELRLSWAMGLRPHRGKPSVLDLASRLLKEPALSGAVHDEIVRSIFEMQASKSPYFVPTPLSELGPQAKTRLRRVAKDALAQKKLSAPMRELASAALRDIEKLRPDASQR